MAGLIVSRGWGWDLTQVVLTQSQCFLRRRQNHQREDGAIHVASSDFLNSSLETAVQMPWGPGAPVAHLLTRFRGRRSAFSTNRCNRCMMSCSPRF